jgi:hypothetical protein
MVIWVKASVYDLILCRWTVLQHISSSMNGLHAVITVLWSSLRYLVINVRCVIEEKVEGKGRRLISTNIISPQYLQMIMVIWVKASVYDLILCRWTVLQHISSSMNGLHAVITVLWSSLRYLVCLNGLSLIAYHHWCCEFEFRSGRGVQHYVIKFVSDLRHVGGFLRVLRFPPPIKQTVTI